jgi:XTP/dITP diphosphohydrolase
VKRLLLATSNPGKVRELRRLLDDCGFEIVTPADLGLDVTVEETGSSYAENAALKARAYARAGACLALADDSGIEVDALGGKPGLNSARYGGEGLSDGERNAALLHEMAMAPPGRRTARYRAVVAIVAPPGGSADGDLVFFTGSQEGRIACRPSGQGGFGYDPIFATGDGRTVAELSPEEKDAVSHRGQAVRAAADYLRGIA